MELRIRKNTISLLFLSAFLFLRIVDVHAFYHIDEDDGDQIECELCDVMYQTQELNVFLGNTAEEITFKSIDVLRNYNENDDYNTFYFSNTLPENVYNKPPPCTP